MSSSSPILSIFPGTRGVGYALFSDDKSYLDSGMITTRNRFTNERYLLRIKKLITKHQPRKLIVEEYRVSHGSVKYPRIRNLIKDIVSFAKGKGIQVYIYQRKHTREVFSFYNVMNKYDIAQLICLWVPELEERMFIKRNEFKMEPYSSVIFDAVSLAITYFYLDD